MEIIKSTTIKLSEDDLRTIITEHLNNKGIGVKDIVFNIRGFERDGDWRAELPLEYKLDNVVCVGTEIRTQSKPRYCSEDEKQVIYDTKDDRDICIWFSLEQRDLLLKVLNLGDDYFTTDV
jgi:hypothetical protein